LIKVFIAIHEQFPSIVLVMNDKHLAHIHIDLIPFHRSKTEKTNVLKIMRGMRKSALGKKKRFREKKKEKKFPNTIPIHHFHLINFRY